MENITIVKILNPERYKSLNQIYGILVCPMEETAVINFDSNKGGLCINVAHGDYGVISPCYWDVIDGKVVVRACGGYIHTGLKIWE